MNRQEYGAIMRDCRSAFTKIASTEVYISSLESENEQLKKDNLDLMKQVEIIGKALDIACDFVKDATGACPYDTYDVCVFDKDRCEVYTDNTCVCYKEYFLKEAGK